MLFVRFLLLKPKDGHFSFSLNFTQAKTGPKNINGLKINSSIDSENRKKKRYIPQRKEIDPQRIKICKTFLLFTFLFN